LVKSEIADCRRNPPRFGGGDCAPAGQSTAKRPDYTAVWRAVFLLILSLNTLGVTVAHADALGDVHRSIVKRRPQLAHISPEALAATPSGDVIIFDVRQPAEFAVSHIEGAVLTAPGTGSGRFFADNRGRLQGTRLVVYCSVGVRSSALADRVRNEALKRGALSVANLEGGIFRWHNEMRPLTAADGPTDFVHPYDAIWGRLLARPQLARSAPTAITGENK
jgi:rhodanese-related sulfurtransferase